MLYFKRPLQHSLMENLQFKDSNHMSFSQRILKNIKYLFPKSQIDNFFFEKTDTEYFFISHQIYFENNNDN